MSSGRSERYAAQMKEHERTSRDKFPKWDAHARTYYNQLKEKDRNGNIKLHSLDHYLYHTHLHNLCQERVQEIQATADAAKLSKGKKPAPQAAAKANSKDTPAAEKGEGGKGGSDAELSDDPSRATLEKAPSKSVTARAARDNEDAADASDQTEKEKLRRQAKSGAVMDKDGASARSSK